MSTKVTYKQGKSIFIPFKDGETILNKRQEARMYKSRKAYEFYFKDHSNPNIELVEYVPVIEAYWIDVTKPGQITCGGNPVYACGNCGEVYGSFEIIPSAKYCKECGARMKRGVRF